jgi:D-alanyl-D-alanine carboxypeptidase/D-alanyl-D-alanine-endopeptidase (penicillin-binding protein 4)
MRVFGLVHRYEVRLSLVDARRAIASLIVVTGCGAIPLVSLWQVAAASARDVDPVATAEPVVAQVTPLLSVRRAADSVHIESQVSGARLGARRLQRELPRNSCLVIRSGGRDVASYGASTPLIPGSNMKLLVAATALEVLGAEYRYTTAVRGTVSGRVVVGNLWLVGGGDPHLVTRTAPAAPRYDVIAPTFLDTLVDELVAQGITTVTGSVVGDGSRYDDERYAPGWGDGIRGVEAGPLGGLVVDDGLPPASLIRRPDPALAAAESLTALLRARGITVVGTPRAAAVTGELPLVASVVSAPLAQSIANVLTNSDNNSAELVLKEIGVASRGEGTRMAGLQVVLDTLTGWELPVDGIALADGSGLDRANLLTCNLLVALLEHEATNPAFIDAMAVGGRTGTLSDVFRTPPARDAIRAKTGTLSGVKALSGTASRGGVSASFALLVNDRRASAQAEWSAWWNRLASAVLTGTRTVSRDALLPIETMG